MHTFNKQFGSMTRRRLLAALAAAGGVAIARSPVSAQAGAQIGPPSTITNPPRDFGPNAPPTTYFSDPDILAVDPSFNAYIQPNTPIKRLWTGALWAEGPA